MGAGDDWAEIAGPLASRFRCWCPDLPGHGNNHLAGQNGPTTMRQIAKTLVAEMDAHHIDRCGLAGYSMGGRLALHLALDYPGRFPKVLLESASPGLESDVERAHRLRQDSALAERIEALEGNSDGFRSFLNEWYDQPLFATLERHPERKRRLIERRMRSNPAELAAALRVMSVGAQENLWKRLGESTPPIQVAAGELDPKFCLIARQMTATNPAISTVIVPECGHTVHIEAPDFFSNLVQTLHS